MPVAITVCRLTFCSAIQIGQHQRGTMKLDFAEGSLDAGIGSVLAAQVRTRTRVVAGFPDVVEQPTGDELDVALRALCFEKPLQLVVAVASVVMAQNSPMTDTRGTGRVKSHSTAAISRRARAKASNSYSQTGTGSTDTAVPPALVKANW